MGEDFKKAFGGAGRGVENEKAINVGEAEAERRLEASERVDALEVKEFVKGKEEERRKEREGSWRVFYFCESCRMDRDVKGRAECVGAGHRVVKARDVKGKKREREEEGGLRLGTGIDWNGHSVKYARNLY